MPGYDLLSLYALPHTSVLTERPSKRYGVPGHEKKFI